MFKAFPVFNPSILTFLFVSVIINFCFAQKEHNNWYFGNGAALSFSTSPPSVLSFSSLYTDEGCASISDSKGRLLFYSDGVKIYDRNHNVMTNGSGLFGHKSATQSATIVPKPGSLSDYFVFTITEKGGANGFCYSIVDLMLNSKVRRENTVMLTPDVIYEEGAGAVKVKNKRLLGPVAEKLCVIRNENGRDYWIVVHKWNSDVFYAYPLTNKGIGGPVISSIGSIYKDYGSGNAGESIGYLKASSDGKWIASAITYKKNQPVELFSFDNKTGKLSNFQKIPTSGYAYGLSFSPDNSKLYVSFLMGKEGVVQYDLSSNDFFDNAFTVIPAEKDHTFGALQNGPDGNIYVARVGSSMDVIENPNLKGSQVKYRKGAVQLSNKYCVYGLPNFAPVFPYESKTEPKTQPITKEEKMVITESKVVKDEKEEDTFNKQELKPIRLNLGNDTVLNCVGTWTLDAVVEADSYKWSNGKTSKSIEVFNTGVYGVTVSNGGKAVNDEVRIEFRAKPSKFSFLPEFNPAQALFNNKFNYTLNDVKSFELKVKTSKGKEVFVTTDMTVFWNGKDKKNKDSPEGTYLWEIEYVPVCSEDGKTTLSEKGEVKLSR